MKELIEIVAAFDTLCAAGKPSALATVIGVAGSAYRRPGARMLVAEDGRTWGGVSGGCLERDVIRRARGVIETGRPVRCCYDTADDETFTPGTATGCGGAVELFIQPLDGERRGPLPYFAQVVRDRRPTTLCTFIDQAEAVSEGPADQCAALGNIGRSAAGEGTGGTCSCAPDPFRPAGIARSYLAASPAGDVFVERLIPPQALVVFGGGPDVIPVVAFAKVLGWHVTVVASRPATRMAERFAAADAVHVTGSDDPVHGVAIAPDAAVVVMTHNVGRDGAILAGLRGPFRYLGLLGPRHRTRRLLEDLPDQSVPGVNDDRFFNPVGLDLAAQTPEEIALAIVTEIQVCLRGASGRPLRDCRGPVHRPVGAEFRAEVRPVESAAAIIGSPHLARCSCPV